MSSIHGLCWAKVDFSKAKPQQWYYNEEPCDLLEWAVASDENGDPIMTVPLAQKVRDKRGKLHIVWLKDGEYPGLTYEVFEHQPGNA